MTTRLPSPGDGRAQELEPGDRVGGLEQVLAPAGDDRVGDQRELFEQARKEELAGDIDAAHDGDLAARLRS